MLLSSWNINKTFPFPFHFAGAEEGDFFLCRSFGRGLSSLEEGFDLQFF